MYFNNDDKLLDDRYGNDQQNSLLDPTSQAQAGGGASQGGSINPGSVGGQGMGGGGRGQAAWTNIQNYLKANPNESPVVSGFEQGVNDAVNKEQENMASYNQHVANPFTDISNQFQTFQGEDPAAKIQNLTSAYTQSDKPVSLDYLGQVGSFLDQDFQNYNLPAYTSSQNFQGMQNAVNDRDAFTNFVNQRNDEVAGRALTGGQRALQNQIDLSSGQYDRARDAALERLAGVQSQADALNAGLADRRSQIGDMATYQNQLRDQFNNSDNYFLNRLAEGARDPMQMMAEWQAMGNVRNSPDLSLIERPSEEVAPAPKTYTIADMVRDQGGVNFFGPDGRSNYGVWGAGQSGGF